MQIEKMFEEGISNGLFTDFHICVRGAVELNVSGGRHISEGARLFDVASLTKSLTHLLLWKFFVQGTMSPNDYFEELLPIPNSTGRQLWHFMSYLANPRNDYFDYEKLRRGEVGSFKSKLVSVGLDDWIKKHKYENYSSAFLGIMLESRFGLGLEELFHLELCRGKEIENLLFHPVEHGIDPRVTVPTSHDGLLRGFTNDLVARAHSMENISLAGVFSDAETIANIFHRTLGPIIESGFYSIAAQNQLEGVDDEAAPYGLGFDIPVPARNLGSFVEEPLVLGGFTGFRIFFTKKPRVTICIATNRTFFGHSAESLAKFSEFSWNVIRELLRQAE